VGQVSNKLRTPWRHKGTQCFPCFSAEGGCATFLFFVDLH
jgi:hypothetical protein